MMAGCQSSLGTAPGSLGRAVRMGEGVQLVKCPEGYKGNACAYIPAGRLKRQSGSTVKDTDVSAFYMDTNQTLVREYLAFQRAGVKVDQFTMKCQPGDFYYEVQENDFDKLLRRLAKQLPNLKEDAIRNLIDGKPVLLSEGCQGRLGVLKDEVILIPLPKKPAENSLPLRDVTWYGAQAFCNWKGGRLPTEAEWERAVQYGVFKPRENVWEWVEDESEARSGRGILRTLRGGGGWIFPDFLSTGMGRFDSFPFNRSKNIGFRCVKTDIP